MTKRAVGDIQARHNERRKKRIREQKLRRTVFFAVIALVVLLCITFFTPIFNIRNVNVEGNQRIKTESIIKHTENIKGKNLFAFGEGRVKKKLLGFAYADRIAIKKKIFPPSITIKVIEREPAMQIEDKHSFIIIDKTGRVLETGKDKQEGVTLIEGVTVASANKGSDIAFKNSSIQKTVDLFTENLKKAGILEDITVISFEDLSNIKFNYQNRLDVVCGSDVDLPRKIGLFKEAINSNKLTENSRGTINLSTTGKAIYTP